MPLIEIRDLTKFYRMGDSVVRALDGVDLDIERGEFIAITGASGSGKSTMMHLLGCLDRPTSGSYRLADQNVSELSDRQLADIRNRQIGFVFQTFNLINRTSATDNVSVPLFYARKANTRAPSVGALERVGLAHRAGHMPNELSGGERQRVAIARAIVNDPVLVLADEPTGNLDSRTGEQIMEIFHQLNAQGVTIIIVTHEPDIALQTRRIVQMRDGKIVSDEINDPVRPTASTQAREPVVIRAVRRDTGGAVAVLDAPPAVAPPVPTEVNGAPEIDIRSMPARIIAGATAAAACGIVAASLLLIGTGISFGLQYAYPQLFKQPADMSAPPKLPPTPFLVFGGIAALSQLSAFVLSILAIVFGRGALRRLRTEIGNWLGRGRAKLGIWLGIATLVAPFALMAISFAVKKS